MSIKYDRLLDHLGSSITKMTNKTVLERVAEWCDHQARVARHSSLEEEGRANRLQITADVLREELRR